MILSCPKCATRFQVKAAAFPEAGRKVKCAMCAHVWHAMPIIAENDEPPLSESVSDAPLPPLPSVPQTSNVPDEVGLKSKPQAEQSGVRTPAKTRRDQTADMIWAGRDVPRRSGGGIKWVSATAAIAIMAAAMVQFRQSVVGIFPGLAPYYRGAGLEVDLVGLQISQIEARTVPDDKAGGVTTLVVTGKVTNVTSADRNVPLIHASLLDKEKHELHSWTFAASAKVLKPGESAEFQQILTQPPEETHEVYAYFADAAE